MEPAPSNAKLIRALGAAAWLTTIAMGIATTWVALGTDLLDVLGGATTTPDQLLIARAAVMALCAITVGYATVGAALLNRPPARRIGGLILLGGLLFALVPFGFMVGGHLSIAQPGVEAFALLLLIGPIAIGPGYVTILPAVAIAFPDGALPAPRWRWPVTVLTVVIVLTAVIELVRPGPIGGGAGAPDNPLGIPGIPTGLFDASTLGIVLSVAAMSVLGIAAVIIRYRRGDSIERQQQRWFLAAVVLAALPLALSMTPGIGGPGMLLVAALGLFLVPVSVGIAVLRYRLYEIDHLINRTLVYVPLTALLAGLYAATVTLLQRVFQSVTGDRSDAAVIISTLILASVFTPVRKWLEGIVDRRFKPQGGQAGHTAAGLPSDPAEWEARVVEIATRVARAELSARGARGRSRG